jgi:hypothetical protein
MNALLKQISDVATEDLASLIESGENDILAAIHKMESEAQLQESKPKFALGFKITVDLDKNTFDCDLSWSLKQTLGCSHQIEDPNQTKLPLERDDESTVTISLPGSGIKPVTVTAKQFSQAAKAIGKNK